MAQTESYPSWLEVRQSGYRTLVGSFVGRTGSARPISLVEFENGRIRVLACRRNGKKRTDLQRFEGRLEGDVLRGETTDDQGRRVALGRTAGTFAEADGCSVVGDDRSSYSMGGT